MSGMLRCQAICYQTFFRIETKWKISH